MIANMTRVQKLSLLSSSKTFQQCCLKTTVRSHSLRRTGPHHIVFAWGEPVEFNTAKILENENIAQNLQRISVDIGRPAADKYTKAGQFVQAKVADSKPGFFALASPPGDSNNDGVVELLIKNQGGTAELLCNIAQGAEVEVSAPMGPGYNVDKLPVTDFPIVLLFATGSGISPIKALIESGALKADQRQNVKLYYGARNHNTMAYADRIPTWESDYGVKVVKVFSEEGDGYVQDRFVNDGGLSSGGQGVGVVLCGQKGMCEAVTEIMTAAGVTKDHILLNF